jgi:glycosyltransferase involved in cell wall biosynthesis
LNLLSGRIKNWGKIKNRRSVKCCGAKILVASPNKSFYLMKAGVDKVDQKVSVVVPIYKVEKYLSKCLDSIITQTYKNLEVILVDDGSPDNCGLIAEQYTERDSRIKVLHKENGGLSDARNYGMKNVTGEYTLFVDSDDWIAPNMIEQLVLVANQLQADVVQAAFYYAYDDYLLFDSRVYIKGSPPIIYDNKSLMAQLVINERVKNFAWGKLYKTKLIKDIPFKKGVLFEDVYWAHQAMKNVKRFVILNNPFYYYTQREDSIVANYSSRNLDIIEGLKERHQFIEEYYRDLTDESFRVLLKTNLIHYNLLLRNRKIDQNSLYRKEIKQFIYENYQKFKKAASKDSVLLKQLILFRLHPYFNVIYLGFNKLLRKTGILAQPPGLEQIEL